MPFIGPDVEINYNGDEALKLYCENLKRVFEMANETIMECELCKAKCLFKDMVKIGYVSGPIIVCQECWAETDVFK